MRLDLWNSTQSGFESEAAMVDDAADRAIEMDNNISIADAQDPTRQGSVAIIHKVKINPVIPGDRFELPQRDSGDANGRRAWAMAPTHR